MSSTRRANALVPSKLLSQNWARSLYDQIRLPPAPSQMQNLIGDGGAPR